MFFLSAYKSVYFFDDTNNIFLSVLSLHLTESLPTFLVEWSMLLKQVRQFARPLSCLLLIYLLRLHSALLYIHVLCTRDRKLNSSSTILSWFYATTIIPIAMARIQPHAVFSAWPLWFWDGTRPDWRIWLLQSWLIEGRWISWSPCRCDLYGVHKFQRLTCTFTCATLLRLDLTSLRIVAHFSKDVVLLKCPYNRSY